MWLRVGVAARVSVAEGQVSVAEGQVSVAVRVRSVWL